MTRQELEHAIRAACDVTGEDEVIVFGSQAILGQYPQAPAALRQSMEADIAPGSGDPDAADRIDGSLGEDSPFHRAHGFYVHGLTIAAATLPKDFVRTLLAEKLVAANKLRLRVQQLDGPGIDRDRLVRWIELTCTDLART